MSAEVVKDLSQQMLRMQIAEQALAVERNRAAILELVERKRNNDANIFAARGYIAQIEEKAAAATTPLERQRLKSQRASQQGTIERQILENLEGAERALGHEEQISSAVKSKTEYELQLQALEAAHGRLSEDTFLLLRKGLEDG